MHICMADDLMMRTLCENSGSPMGLYS